MKSLSTIHKIALGLLALALLTAPLTSMADEAPKEKLSKAKEKYDVDKDGKLSDEEQANAKEGAKEQAKLTREENLKKALEKYDVNKDGKLDDDEKAKMKADEQAAKAAKKAEREARKATKEAAKEAAKEGSK